MYIPKFPKPHPSKFLSRDQLQIVMDYLKKHYVYKKDQKTINLAPCSITDLADHTNICAKTLYNYIQHLRTDPNYNPVDHKKLVNRVMSIDLERQIAMFIDSTYITPGYYFNNKILKVIAMAMWNRAHPHDKLKPIFKASDKWCRNFRKRYNYVWRKARLVRRPKITPETIENEKKFIAKISTLYRKLDEKNELNLLVNADETSWRLCYAGELTWAKKGAESVKINVNYNTKTCLTTLASITANGSKLPLYVLAKGKTDTCEFNQVRGIEGFKYQTDHSKSGWVTQDVMTRYLRWLRKVMNEECNSEGKQIHLILDTYKTHKSEITIQTAIEQNIELIFIPPGCTDRLQPLDVRVFGALKASARGYWYSNYALCPSVNYTKKHAVGTLLICWHMLSEKVIDSAWSLYSKLIHEEYIEENDDDEKMKNQLKKHVLK